MSRSGPMSWKAAATELVLIVAGVLIALAASDWQAARAERRTEVLLLSEMYQSLPQDLSRIRSHLERYRQVDAHGHIVQEALRSGAPYSSQLDAYFGTLFRATSVDLNAAAYESLKSQGLGLVSNDALRSQIVQVYEQTLPGVEGAVQTEGDMVLTVFRPFLLSLFQDVQFGISATPRDYRALQSNVDFLNALDYRLQVVRQGRIGRLEEAVEEVNSLIDSIGVELRRRNIAAS